MSDDRRIGKLARMLALAEKRAPLSKEEYERLAAKVERGISKTKSPAVARRRLGETLAWLDPSRFPDGPPDAHS